MPTLSQSNCVIIPLEFAAAGGLKVLTLRLETACGLTPSVLAWTMGWKLARAIATFGMDAFLEGFEDYLRAPTALRYGPRGVIDGNDSLAELEARQAELLALININEEANNGLGISISTDAGADSSRLEEDVT